jgi:hypothetical protein
MSNIKAGEMHFLEQVLQMEQGYVLNFSDRTFTGFFAGELDIDIDDGKYHEYGRSKAKRLRSFLKNENPTFVGKALRALWQYRCTLFISSDNERDPAETKRRYFEIVERIESGSALPRTDAIERFAVDDETLDELGSKPNQPVD